MCQDSAWRRTIEPFINMCTKIVHEYSCGHKITEMATCAASRRGPCGVSNTKIIKHSEKCDDCDDSSCMCNIKALHRSDSMTTDARLPSRSPELVAHFDENPPPTRFGPAMPKYIYRLSFIMLPCSSQRWTQLYLKRRPITSSRPFARMSGGNGPS